MGKKQLSRFSKQPSVRTSLEAVGGFIGLVTICSLVVTILQLVQSVTNTEQQSRAQATEYVILRQYEASIISNLEKQLEVQSRSATLQASNIGIAPTSTAIAQQQIQLQATQEALKKGAAESKATATAIATRQDWLFVPMNIRTGSKPTATPTLTTIR
ncbi:MAG: hypothetical protein HY868_23445 [Chloroflexi bacterium]|nr:hypothetical protein [Chloroflexota bacterium]